MRGPGLPSRLPGPHHCSTPTQEECSGATEAQRLALHRTAQSALSEDERDTLMALSPPSNTDIALHLAMVATALAEFGLLLRMFDIV